MSTEFNLLRVTSLKEACVSRLEGLILSGELQAGEKLPSERDLAARLGVSRPVLHEALVDLSAKGLVSILPRRGVVVNDYRKSGSVAILSSLLAYNQGNFDPQFQQSLFEMRILLEGRTAALAARKASPLDIHQLNALMEAEKKARHNDISALTELDFEFHLQIAVISGNLVYPLIINSFKNVYTHFTGAFFQRFQCSSTLDEVFVFQNRLVGAIAGHNADLASGIMADMLTHGEEHLIGYPALISTPGEGEKE